MRLTSLPTGQQAALFAAAGVLWWNVVVLLISRLGWAGVAARYPAGQARIGAMLRWRTLGFGIWGPHYRHCVNIGVGPEGLRLSVMFLFRAGHAPILIPWAELSPGPSHRVLWVDLVEVRLTGLPGTSLYFRESIWADVERLRASGGESHR